jgi:hypothetical protein
MRRIAIAIKRPRATGIEYVEIVETGQARATELESEFRRLIDRSRRREAKLVRLIKLMNGPQDFGWETSLPF